MQTGTILFNGTDLALYGSPRFTIARTPEPAAPARATHRRVTITVTVDLQAEMPATVWARAQRLQNLLATTPEGLLEIRSENGSVLAWQAKAGTTSLPESIARRSGRVDMLFTAIETISEESSPLGMSIDPLDGSGAITITRPQDWVESVRISRQDSRSAHRAEIAAIVTFSARTAFADPLLSTAERAEFLLDEAERLKALSSKEGRLMFAGFDRIVQFEALSAKPSPGWEWIDLEAQARYVTLPGETVAEVSFTVDTATDPATGETRTTVSGKVEAPDKATAETKIDAMLTVWRSPTRRVMKILKKDTYQDGEDAEESAGWTGMDFSFEFSEGSNQTRYTLKIDTHEGADGSRTSYSGTAYATTLEILLATVQTAAGGKHPVEMRSELSVEYATDDEGTAKLMQGSFIHEYQTAATTIRGAVSRVTSQGQMNDWQSSVSGTISAPNYAAARAVARSFIPAGIILRQDEETEEKSFIGTSSPAITTTEQLGTLAFSYAWITSHTNTAIEYDESSTPDYTRMVMETTISGTARAVDKDTARADVTALLTSLGLTNPTRSNLVQTHEMQKIGVTTTDRWLSFKFSHTFEGPLTGDIGHDIIEATFVLQRIGMVDHIPITEIPLGMPVQQTPFGFNIGRLVASGSVKARVKASARDWGQEKRAHAARIGEITGAADPPEERLQHIYVPFDGSNVACYEFSFQYGFRYSSGLEGLMP